MTNKPGRPSQMTDKLRDELILGWTWSGDKGGVFLIVSKRML